MDVPDLLNTKKLTINNKKPAVLIKSVMCSKCLRTFERDRITEIKYRMLIKHTPDYEMPLLIKNTHPRLGLKDYRKLKMQDKFLEKQAKLCFDCYLHFTSKLPTSGLSSPTSRLEIISGIGPLNPSRLQSRRLQTISSMSRQTLLSPSLSRSSSRNIFSSSTTKTAGGELILMPFYPI